jgi:hypothetical protein
VGVAGLQQELRGIGRALAALADQQDLLVVPRQMRGRVGLQLALGHAARALGHAAGPFVRLAHIDQHRAMGQALARLRGESSWMLMAALSRTWRQAALTSICRAEPMLG